jgi:hypothetical protein
VAVVLAATSLATTVTTPSPTSYDTSITQPG